MSEDARETIKTILEAGEAEEALRAARDAAKRLFETVDALLEKLAEANEPKASDKTDIEA